jgi:hypothetical protein
MTANCTGAGVGVGVGSAVGVGVAVGAAVGGKVGAGEGDFSVVFSQDAVACGVWAAWCVVCLAVSLLPHALMIRLASSTTAATTILLCCMLAPAPSPPRHIHNMHSFPAPRSAVNYSESVAFLPFSKNTPLFVKDFLNSTTWLLFSSSLSIPSLFAGDTRTHFSLSNGMNT